jgi:hypothetical protein
MDFSLPSFSSSGPTTSIRLESEPPGADAKTSLGPSCQTPCSLNVTTTSEFSVTYTLNGYVTQTIAVTPRPPEDIRLGGSRMIQFDPNPVYAQLELAPPPAKKKPVAKKKPAARPAT